MPTVNVRGTPRPKGSLVCKGNRKCPGCGQLVVHRVLEDAPPDAKAWRENLTLAAKAVAARYGRIHGPVVVDATFVLERPGSHYGTGRNADTLKPSAPEYPAGMVGDVDKLARMVLDACTDAALWDDDARVVDLYARKRYPSPDTLDRPGLILLVEPAPTIGGLL